MEAGVMLRILWMIGMGLVCWKVSRGAYKAVFGVPLVIISAFFPIYCSILVWALILQCDTNIERRQHRKGLFGELAPDILEVKRDNFKSTVEVRNPLDAMVKYKMKLNSLSKQRFDNDRFFEISEERPGLNEVSRGYRKLLGFLPLIKDRLRSDMKIVDLCCGSGGWSQLLNELYPEASITACSWWNKKAGHNTWSLPENPRIQRIEGDYKDLEVEKTDLILFDGGEACGNAIEEANRFEELFIGVMPWIEENRKAEFVLKILTPGKGSILTLLKRIRKITGKGVLLRSKRSRNSNGEMYFVSGDFDQNYESEVVSMYLTLMDRIDRAEEMNFQFDQGKLVGPQIIQHPEGWENEMEDKELPPLNCLDMSKSIKEFCDGVKVEEPRRINRFLKELCWFRIDKKSSSPGVVNPFVDSCIGALKRCIPEILSWRSTVIDSKATYEVVVKKVDKAPLENHVHGKKLKIAYNTILKYLKKKKQKMTKLNDSEIGNLLNNKGGMGRQENGLAKDLGSYFRSGKWRLREKEFMKELRKKTPILSVLNSQGKGEKKQNKKDAGSRLIWFGPGTYRICELRTLGRINDIVKKLPFSVCGLPIFDYGSKIDKHHSNQMIIADDIAGWDTKLSKYDLRLEAKFLMDLCDDEEQKKDIELFYSLYANKIVAISRPGGKNYDELALYRLRGQRGSGEIVTYAMNTITNGALILCRMAVSHGISEENMEKYMIKVLEGMDSGKRDGEYLLVSGDDSLIGSSVEGAKKIATVGRDFLNDVGKPRKNLTEGAASPIYEKVEDASFCSHYFVRVKIGNHEKRMPCRLISEILGKARMMLKVPRDREDQESWARAIGFQLIMTYPHINEVRRIGRALLSCTDSKSVLTGIGSKSMHVQEPWLSMKTAQEAIRSTFDGTCTRYPIGNYGFGDIGFVKDSRFCVRVTTARREWKKYLKPTVEGIKKFVGLEKVKIYGHEAEYIDELEEYLPNDAVVDVAKYFINSVTRM